MPYVVGVTRELEVISSAASRKPFKERVLVWIKVPKFGDDVTAVEAQVSIALIFGACKVSRSDIKWPDNFVGNHVPMNIAGSKTAKKGVASISKIHVSRCILVKHQAHSLPQYTEHATNLISREAC